MDIGENEETGSWVEVVRKGKKSNPPRVETPTIIGTKKTDVTRKDSESDSDELQAAIRRAWLYIGKLHQNTSADKIKRHLQKLDIDDIIGCEELPVRGRLKAYKVGIPLKDLPKASAPESWPEGILVRRYKLFRPRSEGIRIED